MSVIRILGGSLAFVLLACRPVVPEAEPSPSPVPPPAPRLISSSPSNLARFADESELRAYLDRIRRLEAVERAHLERRRRTESPVDVWDGVSEMVAAGSPTVSNPSTSVVAFDAVAAYVPSLEVSDLASITNNQERGVDEGDIVKRIGRFLIVLRRGRLHSIEIGTRAGDLLRLVDVQDVFPLPFRHEAWYDEVLVEGDRVVVLGYSYETEATEIAVFELDRRGRFHHRASHAIRSSDYYSWENYGSRLVDGKLVIYSPIDLADFRDGGGDPWPVHSTWGRDGLDPHWRPLVEDVEIVAPVQAGFPTTLHAVIDCRIDAALLECGARGIVGSWDAVHYVSPSAVYLWTRGGRAPFDPMAMDPDDYARWLEAEGDGPFIVRWPFVTDEAMVHRIPFDASPIGVVEVAGAPYDQFSFRQSGDFLDLFLVREHEQERAQEPGRDRRGNRSTPSLWRIPLASFERALDDPIRVESTTLPGLASDGWCREQRFVADHLLYADCPKDASGRTLHGVHVVDLESDGVAEFVEMPGDVARIEPLGDHALIVGDGLSRDPEWVGSHLTPILLGREVRRMASYFLPELVEVENRSHAFNWTSRTPGFLMGLPFASLGAKWRGAVASDPDRVDLDPPSLIAYFTMSESGNLAEVGRLAERRPVRPPPDDCETSCFDWYGSVRPIFLDDRIFGLLGDELVEGRLQYRGIRELQRVRLRRWGSFDVFGTGD